MPSRFIDGYGNSRVTYHFTFFVAGEYRTRTEQLTKDQRSNSSSLTKVFDQQPIRRDLFVESNLEVFKQNQFAGLKPRQGEQVVRDDGLEPPTYSV